MEYFVKGSTTTHGNDFEFYQMYISDDTWTMLNVFDSEVKISTEPPVKFIRSEALNVGYLFNFEKIYYTGFFVKKWWLKIS